MVMFKWHSAGSDSCYRCKQWNGQVFHNLDAVPDLPVHENCQCYIEALGPQNGNQELATAGAQLEKARQQVKDEIAQFTFYGGLPNLLERLVHAANSLADDLSQVQQTFEIFWQNYQDMKEANTIGGDKYFHSKANAAAAQLGETGEATAKFISDFREAYEYYTNVHFKGMSLKATIGDMMADQKANQYGRERGRQFPQGDPGELVDILRPRGLDRKY